MGAIGNAVTGMLAGGRARVAESASQRVVLRGRRVQLRQLDREDFEAWSEFRLDNTESLEASGPAWPMGLDDPRLHRRHSSGLSTR